MTPGGGILNNHSDTIAPLSLARTTGRATLPILLLISFCHFLNDMMQSLLPSLYPMLKHFYDLSFVQIGLVTLATQLTASLLQPIIGQFTDRSPRPYSLAMGMGVTLVGLVLLATAGKYGLLLAAAACVGIGSAVFHPESSRVARMASGGRHGFAQSVFQVGGNMGSAVGPLLGAFIVVPHGQRSVIWLSVAALLGIAVLLRVGRWYQRHGLARLRRLKLRAAEGAQAARPKAVAGTLALLLVLIFSKYFYLASLGSYYQFYLIQRFNVSEQSAQIHLFIFLAAAAAGTLVGGSLGDRFGRKYVIWGSILGVLPFSLLLPHANLFWTGVLTVPIGLILASAFPAIVVYAQELIPGRTGMVSGLFFGFAYGMGGIGAVTLGRMADIFGITVVYQVCAFLPAIGLLAVFLPALERRNPVSHSLPPSGGHAPVA
jgi:FSR family fosmidomycin resistance protein-like MFS transporter